MGLVNFVTAHDGFTLNDLVTYNDKHNEANGEDNKDGTSDNRSWNCGAEGPTDDPAINALRAAADAQLARDAAAAQGTPMLLAGDEFGAHAATATTTPTARTTRSAGSTGTIDEERQALAAFVQKLTGLRHQYPILRRSAS